MKRTSQVRGPGRGGFTIVEVLVASAVSLTVAAVTLTAFIYILQSWHGAELRMQADRDMNIAMSRMVYGMDDRLGLRSAAAVTKTDAGDGWTVLYRTGGTSPQTNSFTYSATTRNLVFNPGSKIAGRDLAFAQANVQVKSLVVTMRVDRVDGDLRVRREISTAISFRNF